MAILSLDTKTLIIYIITLKVKIKVVDLLNKMQILVEYLNDNKKFLSNFVVKLLKHSNNNYVIKLKKGK